MRKKRISFQHKALTVYFRKMVLKYVNNHDSKKRDQVQILETWKRRSFFKSFFFSKHREIICSHCCPEKKAGLQQQEQKKEQPRCKSNSLEPTNAFKWAQLTSEASLAFYIFYSFGKNLSIFGLFLVYHGCTMFSKLKKQRLASLKWRKRYKSWGIPHVSHYRAIVECFTIVVLEQWW